MITIVLNKLGNREFVPVEEGTTLREFLQEEGISLDSNEILLNGEPAELGAELREDDIVKVITKKHKSGL